jgi:hypothetical protein
MKTIIILLIAHWIADFVLQSRRDAEAKSHDVIALIRHVSGYSAFMTLIAFFILSAENAVWFGVITFVFHFITDYFTSKATTYTYLKTQDTFAFRSNDWNLNSGDILTANEGAKIRIIQYLSGGDYRAILLKTYDKWSKLMWSTIGFDQLLHTAQILLTIKLLQ